MFSLFKTSLREGVEDYEKMTLPAVFLQPCVYLDELEDVFCNVSQESQDAVQNFV